MDLACYKIYPLKWTSSWDSLWIRKGENVWKSLRTLIRENEVSLPHIEGKNILCSLTQDKETSKISLQKSKGAISPNSIPFPNSITGQEAWHATSTGDASRLCGFPQPQCQRSVLRWCITMCASLQLYCRLTPLLAAQHYTDILVYDGEHKSFPLS